MLKDMSELSEVIHKKAVDRLTDHKWFLRTTNEANKRFDMPIDIASDYLNGNKRIKENDWFSGFVIASVIDSAEAGGLRRSLVEEYFTPMEIAQYKDQKCESRTVTRIDIPMLQVASDQWIGAVTFQWLMNVEDSHLMCYNENTQRIPRVRAKSSGGVIYEPFVNQKSVREIVEAFKRGDYIPNTITFNLREQNGFVFEDGHFIMEGFPRGRPIFDIIDGYHRYRAMRQVYISNPDFDYGMELRITNFSVEKARQFVYQESLRNKMRKVDAASFDQNSLENQIVDELNETSPFRNMFSGVDAKIDRAVMAAAIRNKYFRNADTRTRARKVEAKKALMEKGKMLEEEYPEMFDRKWTNREIVSFVVTDHELVGKHFVSQMKTLMAIADYHDMLQRKSLIESEIRAIMKKAEEDIDV